MILSVTEVQYDGGTIAIGVGINEQGRTVRFGGDWRPMQELAEGLALAAEEGGEVQVEIEPWQVLGSS